MTTNVSFFAPYICADKALHVSVINPKGVNEHILSQVTVTKANQVHTLVIHDYAMIQIREINLSDAHPDAIKDTP